MSSTTTFSIPLYLQPPSVALAVFAVAYAINRAFAPWHADFSSPLPGGMLIAAGLGLIVWARMQYRRHGTTLLVGKDSADLVTAGPFRYSRNPMYIGVLTTLSGLGLCVGTLPALLTVPAVFLVLRFFHIPREERMLLARFGDRYRNYCAAVRRWL